jgi:lysophospholipase L1-like esterase
VIVRLSIALTWLLLGALVVFVWLECLMEARAARHLYHKAAVRLHPFLQIVASNVPTAPGSSGIDGVNEEGFRGEEIAVEKPANTFRLFALGGSTTLGISNPYVETYPAVLQRLLAERYPGVRIEVQNAACDWYTSAHSLVNYDIRVRRFHPDAIIVMHAMNDLVRSFSPPWAARGPYRPDYSHYLGPQMSLLGPQATVFDAAPRFVRGDFLLIRYLKQALHHDPSPFDHSPVNLDRLRAVLRPKPIAEFRSLPSFRENLDKLVRSAQSDGLRRQLIASEPFIYREDLSAAEQRRLLMAPVFCTEKGEYPDLASMLGGMRRFNEVAREVAATDGAGFVDFAAAVPKRAENFTDDVHLTAKGNELVARAAFDRIVAERWVEAVTGPAAD